MRAKKRFGQHFLCDETVISRIIGALAPNVSDNVVEIGPGRGALTWHLLPHLHRLTAIEIDRDLAPKLLADQRAKDKLNVIQEDVLLFDFNTLGQNLRVVGNLPYNISTPIFFHLIPFFPKIIDMHFMVQKEVAERLAAVPFTKDYGRLTVMIQYHAKVELLFEIGPHAFSPPPKVDSAVIRITPHGTYPWRLHSEEVFQELVTMAFRTRRKTIWNNLKGFVDPTLFSQTGIDPSRRPETISVEEYVNMANTLCR